ncbi:MAG: hypothetical protein ABI398_09010 [Devosia sp.]
MPNWIIEVAWPTIVFFGAMWPTYLPFSLLFIFAFAGMITAVWIAVREDRPQLWWVLPPLAIPHFALFFGRSLYGWGGVACLAAELGALTWLIWSTRENKLLAALATYFALAYAFLPFVFSLAAGSM